MSNRRKPRRLVALDGAAAAPPVPALPWPAAIELEHDTRPLVQGCRGGWRFPVGEHLVVGTGPSVRGPWLHCVVSKLTATSLEDGAPLELSQVHDPHPLGAGIAEHYDLLVPVGMYEPAPRQWELTA